MSRAIIVFVNPVPGFEEEYGISEDGDVYCYRLKRFLKTTLSQGYYNVKLSKEGKQYCKRLHRLLADTYISNPDNLPFIDHIDRDKTNNDLSNLRWCTRQENSMNASKSKGNTSSQYKGVCWDKQKKKWQSQIMIDGKNIYLGCFLDEEKAARKYDQKAIEHFGEFASLNNS